jgi:serine/threonine protein kinase
VTESTRAESMRAKVSQSQPLGNLSLGGASAIISPPSQISSSQQPQGLQTSPSLQSQIEQTMQGSQGAVKDLRLLIPGTLLRSGRYRLRELKSRQEWQGGVYEAMWTAQDAQRSGSEVTICELVTPESGSMMIQSFLRTATMALTSIGRHPRVPTLWDAFGDQGRNFFVFEPVEGESLLSHMRRTGRALPEQDVIECCLQMTEILELLAMQSPPLIHGLISPEHIIQEHQNGEYVLTDFSVVLAGGATQFISGIDRLRLSPYMAPEFSRAGLDTRSDMYSMLASAYHAVTGSIPANINGSDTIPQAQQLNPNVSLQFNAILAKGLRPNAGQRYQRPAELRQELLSLRSRAQSYSNPASFSQRSGPLARDQSLPVQPAQSMQPSMFPRASSTNNDLAQILPNMLGTLNIEDEQEQRLLLPRPEELPPLRAGNDNRQAALWLVGILLCLIIVVLLSRGLA